jgi:hypothetical protein
MADDFNYTFDLLDEEPEIEEIEVISKKYKNMNIK